MIPARYHNDISLASLGVWLLLAACALGAGTALARAGLPGGTLIGPLLVGIVASVSGWVTLRVPRPLFTVAQAAVGCLIAASFTPTVVSSIVRDWASMLMVIVTTVGAAGVTGWVLARFGSLPASTAAWGSAPGGASAMVLLSADEGADPRLVAFMQYLRVTIVVLSAGAVARVLLPHAAHVATPGSRAIDPAGWAQTLLVGVVGTLAALRLRVPAAALLGPMVLGAVAGGLGLVRLDDPWWALDFAYVTIGLGIGLLYTRATVRYALRALPQMLAGTLLLIVLCGVSAAVLVATVHVDALTAYLATTPGGLDSVTLIAIGSGANVPLVLAIQALRVFAVILAGPAIAKLIARVA